MADTPSFPFGQGTLLRDSNFIFTTTLQSSKLVSLCQAGETKAQKSYIICQRSPTKEVAEQDPGILTRTLYHDTSLPTGAWAESVSLGSETPGTWGPSTSVIRSTAIYTAPCHPLSPPKWFSFSPCLIFQWTHPGTSRSPHVTDLLTYPAIFFIHQGQHGGVWEEGAERGEHHAPPPLL